MRKLIPISNAAFEEWENSRERRKARLRADRLAAAREKGTHTKQEWKILHDLFGRCVACGIPFDMLTGGHATKDHIVPIFFGGCDCLANLQPVCRDCNSSGMFGDMRETALPGWQTLYLHRLGVYF